MLLQNEKKILVEFKLKELQKEEKCLMLQKKTTQQNDRQKDNIKFVHFY